MLSLTSSFILLTTLFVFIIGVNYLWLKFRMRDQNNARSRPISRSEWMTNTMGCILILFGILKLLNLPGFVHIFQKYDVLSQLHPGYAFLYPFIEVGLGLSLLTRWHTSRALVAVITLMAVSIVSVVVSLLQGQNLRCGCLGSFFHIPLSYVTLSENVIMILMSVAYWIQ